MSQFLCSSINSKSYLMSSSNKDSSHPTFWSERRSSSEAIAWSYPPKSNLCAKVFAGISAKLADFSHNYNTFNTQLFHNNNSQIDELLSTQVLRRMGSFSESDCVSPSSADRTAFLSDEERLISSANNCCDSSVDSDSSNGEKNNQKIQQICDSKVVQSMQNDRQKKKKRKRRRRKKKSLSKSSQPCSSVPWCSMSFSNNDFISIIFDNDCSYDSNEDISSDEELTCLVERIAPDLEKMCKSLFVDCFFSKTVCKPNNSGVDEIDCCQTLSSVEPHLAEEEEEMMTSIEELIKKANEKWSNSYSNVSSDDRISAKVNFTSEKPSVRTLHVWDYASRQARCGHWGQLAIDRKRFADRCRRINAEIGHIFGKEHRLKVYRERVLLNA